MPSIRSAIAKNAISNLVRGATSAVVAVVLPHFLTRALGGERFAGWALMLQLVAYVNYLDFGVQTAVARYLAGALQRNDRVERDRLLSSAVAILLGAGAVALFGLGVLVWQLPNLFRTVPIALCNEMRGGLMILGLSTAIGLPLSAYSGALIGMQRNEFPALAIGGSRIVGAVAVVFAANHTQSLFWLACLIGSSNLAGALIQYVIAEHLLGDYRFQRSALNGDTTKELIKYCSALSVWSFAMLLVSGLDVTIVGLFDFSAAGAYSIAATLILFFTGLNGAAFTAMLAPIAAMQAGKDYARIERLVLVATRLGSYLSLSVIACTFLFGKMLIQMWVGPAYLSITWPVLEILVIAQAIRLTGNAYGTMLVAMGHQRYGILPVLIEGFSNLTLSLIGMKFLGPIGVALATLGAAAIGMSVNVFAVMPRVEEVRIRTRTFLSHAVLHPVAAFAPLSLWVIILGLLRNKIAIHGPVSILGTSGMLFLTMWMVRRGIAGAGQPAI
jgi:O-antigen/teichoic acid export membrane protein